MQINKHLNLDLYACNADEICLTVGSIDNGYIITKEDAKLMISIFNQRFGMNARVKRGMKTLLALIVIAALISSVAILDPGGPVRVSGGG